MLLNICSFFCGFFWLFFLIAFLNLKWNFGILAFSILCLIHLLSNLMCFCCLAFPFLFIYIQIIQISSTKRVHNGRGISYVLDFEFYNFILFINFDLYNSNSIFRVYCCCCCLGKGRTKK